MIALEIELIVNVAQMTNIRRNLALNALVRKLKMGEIVEFILFLSIPQVPIISMFVQKSWPKFRFVRSDFPNNFVYFFRVSWPGYSGPT